MINLCFKKKGYSGIITNTAIAFATSRSSRSTIQITSLIRCRSCQRSPPFRLFHSKTNKWPTRSASMRTWWRSTTTASTRMRIPCIRRYMPREWINFSINTIKPMFTSSRVSRSTAHAAIWCRLSHKPTWQLHPLHRMHPPMHQTCFRRLWPTIFMPTLAKMVFLALKPKRNRICPRLIIRWRPRIIRRRRPRLSRPRCPPCRPYSISISATLRRLFWPKKSTTRQTRPASKNCLMSKIKVFIYFSIFFFI